MKVLLLDTPLLPNIKPFVSDPNNIRFQSLIEDTALFPVNDTNNIHVVTEVNEFPIDGYRIARLTEFENPMETLETFVEHAKSIACQMHANTLVIADTPFNIYRTPLIFPEVEGIAGFVADLYYVPKATLGVMWEPGDLALGKYTVRRFRDYSQADDYGLGMEDQVLEMDCIDVLQGRELIKRRQRWQIGESIDIVVLRDGKKTWLKIPLVENKVK